MAPTHQLQDIRISLWLRPHRNRARRPPRIPVPRRLFLPLAGARHTSHRRCLTHLPGRRHGAALWRRTRRTCRTGQRAHILPRRAPRRRATTEIAHRNAERRLAADSVDEGPIPHARDGDRRRPRVCERERDRVQPFAAHRGVRADDSAVPNFPARFRRRRRGGRRKERCSGAGSGPGPGIPHRSGGVQTTVAATLAAEVRRADRCVRVGAG